VLYRIETHTPKAPCSVVAEEMGDEAMCSFMKSDGDEELQNDCARRLHQRGAPQIGENK
jgi:hypothetical protein